MNGLCYDIERWENTKKTRKFIPDFDYHLMIDDSVEFNEETFEKIKEVYEDFNKTIRMLLLERSKCSDWEKNREWIKKYMGINKKEALAFDVNWNYYYAEYRKKLLSITKNKAEIVNCLVKLCYELYPKSSKKILWSVAGEWVVDNIKQVNEYVLVRDKHGDLSILGEHYRWEKADAERAEEG